MSGYSHTGWPNVLDNECWTEKAQEICFWIGHPQTKSFASHVEKQLIAFFAVHHQLLDSSSKPKEAAPPWLPMPPVLQLTVSKAAACHDCATFIDRFQNSFGVTVVLTAVGEQ